MGSDPGIIEISSDEDDFGVDDASYDWISEFFDDEDGETAGFDDVIVVDEFSTPAVTREQNFAYLRPRRGTLGDDSEDDCLVLDADPDNPVLAVDNQTGGGDGLDELLIVGEKGQLACRDYPHPRHLCASFPFSTTLHEKHCNLCHCYVCDSPAPCIYWTNDVSAAGHCHSTDKEGKWKALRISFKQGNTAAPQPTMPPLQNPVSVHRPIPILVPTTSSNSRTLRNCPATNAATRNPTIHGHRPRPIVISYRGKRLGQHPSKSQPLISRTQYAQIEKRGASALPAQIMQSHTKLRRVEISGNSLAGNRTNWLHHGQACRDPPQSSQGPPVRLLEEHIKKWHDVLHGVSDDSNKSSTTVQPQAATSELSAFSQYLSATNLGQNVDTYIHPAPPSADLDPLYLDCSWLNNNSTCRAEDLPPATLQPSNPSVSGEIHLDPFPDDGKEVGLSDLDSNTLLYDFDNTWSSIAQV